MKITLFIHYVFAKKGTTGWGSVFNTTTRKNSIKFWLDTDDLTRIRKSIIADYGYDEVNIVFYKRLRLGKHTKKDEPKVESDK